MGIDWADLIQQTWFLITAIAVGALLCIIILVWVIVLVYHHSCKRQIRELDERYNTLHTSFSADCSNMVARLKNISSNNASYVSIYTASKKRFVSILNNSDKSCFVAISSLKELIGNKDYKNIKGVIDSTRQSMNDYTKAAKELTDDLLDKLHSEDEFHSKVVPIKEKFRNLKTVYRSNESALHSISSSFETLFDHITNMFTEFEECLLRADYKNAENTLNEMDKLINATNAIMKDIPYLNTLGDKVIPEKIQELSDTYVDLENHNYPLHNLFINSNIEDMHKQLDACNESLSNLSIKGVGKCFEDITMRINGFMQDFEKEKEAKVEFDKIQGGLTSSTYLAEKQFANLRNSLPNYQNIYKINSTYLEQIAAMQDLIDEMSTSKRKLDSYINSSTKQPYSLLLRFSHELKSKINRIQGAFDDFHDYLGQMKKDADNAYALIRDGYVGIKEKEYVLREMNIASLTEIMTPKLDNCYNKLVEIDNVLNVTPIDILQLNAVYDATKKDLDLVFQEVDEAKDNALKAENLIAYCNKYRADSYEAKVGLEKAETSFLEADFRRAQAQAAQIYKEQASTK